MEKETEINVPLVETENVTEQNETNNLQNLETTEKPEWVFDSEESFKKILKSTASKAKNEIMSVLKENGINSLDEVKRIKKENSEYSEKFSNYSKTIENLEASLEITKLGIKEELKDDFLILAKNRVSEKTDLNTAMKAVLEAHPYFIEKTIEKNIKIGVEKSSQKIPNDITLQKKYPWIK